MNLSFFKKGLSSCICLCISVLSMEATAQQTSLQPFPLASVRLLDSDFKEAHATSAQYILALDADKLLAPFLKEAGLTPVKPAYGNWESDGLDGHTCGHYITALAQMAATTGDTIFTNRLNYVINWLEACQKANGNGYVGGVPSGKELWEEIGKGNIGIIWRRWVPWYNIHKTYAGLIDAYLLTGNEKAKAVVMGMGEWALQLTKGLTDSQMQQMLGNEFGGMNEAFALLASISGDARYIELSKRFAHRAILDPLLSSQDAITGLHANTQIPKVIGFMKYGALTRDQEWIKASDYFWRTVVESRTVAFGGNSVREHFNSPADFGPMLDSREGPETCNSYNMLKLTKALFLNRPSAHYIDYYERTLYNHILSSQHPEGGFVYFTPIHPQHYRVYSQPQQAFWCCVGSGIENHSKYGELIYAHDSTSLYVNLFIPSELNWEQRKLRIQQTTRFPFANTTELVVQMAAPQQLALKIRNPKWLAAKATVMVNGKPVQYTLENNGYFSINRQWKPGDKVSIALPMKTVGEKLPDGSPWLAFMHGPLLLAAVTDTAKQSLPGLKADGSRWGHIAHGKLIPDDEAPLLVLPNDTLEFNLPVKDANTLSFTADGLIHQAAFKQLTLQPFYKVHDARYMMYWPYTTQKDLAGFITNLQQKTERKKAIEAATIDVVYPGEQQPEADHFFEGADTKRGTFRERHFRGGTGWFSYQLRNPQAEATSLSFTCYGMDVNGAFEITLNDVLLKTYEIKESKGAQFYDIITEIPADIKEAKTITVRFQSLPNASIPSIYEVRLLR